MSKLILTADQIYALAYVIKAKYLDNYYISLSNRTDDNKLWLSEITSGLVSSGVLVEDFSGEISVDPAIDSIVRPIYFGGKESSLDINIFGESENNIGYRFHFYDGRITMTKTVDEGFEVTSVTADDIKTFVKSILDNSYSADSEQVEISFDKDNVSRLFVIKNTEVGVKNNVTSLVEYLDVVYEENSQNEVFSLSKIDFDNKLVSILTEG